MADRFPTAGQSEEQCVHNGGILANKNKKNCDRCIKPNMALQATIRDTLSMETGGDQIAEDAVTHELESVLVVPINSEIGEAVVVEELTNMANTVLNILVDPANSDPVGGNNDDSVVNIDQLEEENVPTHEKVIQVIARAIKAVGAVTVCAAVKAAHSEPASRALFGHNKLAYNITLAVIFALGIAEFITGLLISMSGGLTYQRRLWIGGIVLFLSILLLGCIHMGGFA